MADKIIVKIEPATLQVKPGAQASAVVTVRNRTEEVGNYLITLEGVPGGWAEAVPDQLSAFPLQDVQTKLNVHPPANARGATYHVTVRAASQEDAALSGSARLDVDVPLMMETPPPATTAMPPPPTTTVPPVMPQAPPSIPESRVRPAATPPPTSPTSPPTAARPRPQAAAQIEVVAELVKDSKLPPPTVQWKLSLRNAGNVLDTFAFSIAGIKPAWVRLEPPQVTLNPEERGSAILTVTPAPDTPAGAYPFVVRTFSHLNLSQRTEIPLTIEVRASVGFQMVIDPREAETQGQREFRVALASSPTSNTDLWINLSASDQDNACDYVFEQPQIFLPAKQTVVGILRVRPRTVLGPNERKTYTFKVSANERDGKAPSQTAEARLTQVATVPLRLVLRPQVNSGEVEADYTVLTVNPSGVESSLVLAGEDPELGCEYTFQPPRVTLPPGGETQVKLKVRARSNYDDETHKDYAFTVTATRVGELVPVASAQGKFTQQPLKPIKLVLIPPQLSSTGSAKFIVKASNPRPRAVQVLLTANDEADALAFSLSPSEINLAPGSEGSATVNVRPKDRLMKGEQRRVHKFTVMGNVEGSAEPPTAKGTLAQIQGVDLSGASVGGFKLSIWLLRWLVFFIVLLLLTTVLLAGVELVQRGVVGNEDLAKVLSSFLNPETVRTLLNISPFGGPSRWLVGILLDIARAINPSLRK